MITKVGLNIQLVDGDNKKIEKKNDKFFDDKSLSTNSVQILNNEKDSKKEQESKPVVTNNYRALWVIDEKNNVLIRIEDEKGNLIKQIPPEELVNLKERINELMKNYFKVEA